MEFYVQSEENMYDTTHMEGLHDSIYVRGWPNGTKLGNLWSHNRTWYHPLLISIGSMLLAQTKPLNLNYVCTQQKTMDLPEHCFCKVRASCICVVVYLCMFASNVITVKTVHKWHGSSFRILRWCHQRYESMILCA